MNGQMSCLTVSHVLDVLSHCLKCLVYLVSNVLPPCLKCLVYPVSNVSNKMFLHFMERLQHVLQGSLQRSPHKMFLHFMELLQNLLHWLHGSLQRSPHKMFLHFRELLPNVLYSDCKPLHTDFNQFYIGFTPAFTP